MPTPNQTVGAAVFGSSVRAGASTRRPSRRAMLAIFLGLVLVVSALAIPLFASTARAAPPFRSLRIGEAGMAVTTLNPMLITLTDEYVVVYNVYSTLLTWDKNYTSMGDLAYNWSLAPDDVTWTFHLVHGAYFVDPTNPMDRSHPVTSSDVVFTYNLQMNLTGSVFYSYVTQIRALSAPDPYTVQIITGQPSAVMFTTLATVPILPQYIWSGISNPLKYSPAYPVGSGPMYYDSTNSTLNSLIVFRRSPSYYGPAYYCRQVRPDEVRFIAYASSAVMVNAFVSGADSLDAIEGIDPTSYVNALGSWAPKWGVDEGFVGEFSINVMTPAIRAAYNQFHTGSNNLLLLNLTVRQAIAMSINKTTLVQDALLGLGHVADSLVPDSSPWHYPIPTNELFRFNTSAARALLNAAGWKYDASGTLNPSATPLYRKGATNNTVYWPLQFRFYTLNSPAEWQVAAQDIVAWLAQAGIQTTDRLGNTVPGYGLYSLNQMSSYWSSGDYDMWLWDWVFAPGSDPSLDILEVETTMAIGPTSDNFYSNATYDSLYNQSLVTVDPSARRTLTNTMQDMIYRYASYILPYYKLNLFAALNGTRWTNWGDWSVTPGLAPDSDLPDLWFQVEPVDNRAPAIQAFPSVQGYNGTVTTLAVNASDPDGDNLTFTWTFGDGSAPEVTTSATVQHVYATPGNYTLGVTVSDGEWLACANSTANILPYVPGANTPPLLYPISPILIYSFANGTRFGLVDQAAGFMVSVQDAEGDPVYLTWYWGDGLSTSQLMTGTQNVVTSAQTHNYTAVGNYTVSVVATDNQTGTGNHTVTVSVSDVLILSDTAPPVTTATLSGTVGQNGWYLSSVQVTLTATDDLAVLGTFYSINGGTPTAYTGPFTLSADGASTVDYASVDVALNLEPVKSLTVQIETAGPTTTASLSGTAGSGSWYVSPVQVTLTATPSESSIVSTRYRVDGGAWQTYTAPFTIGGDANHTLEYQSTDSAGFTESPVSRSVPIDTAAPTVSASVAGTSGTGGWYVSAAQVTLTASDAVSGLASISYAVDGGAWTTYAGPFSLSGGAHTVVYRATDEAGNTAAIRSLTVNVDTTAPTLANLAPSGHLTTASVVVTWTGSDTGSGIASYAISVDGGAFQDLGAVESATLLLSDGTHTIAVRATDAAGNSVTMTTTVTVDTNVFSFTGPYGGLPAIALIVALVMAAVALVWIWRRRKAAGVPPKEPQAPPGP